MVERSLQKMSSGMHVAYSTTAYSNNLSGKNFSYHALGGRPYLHIDMSGNLRVRNKRANCYEDALEFLENHTLLNYIELDADVVKRFAQIAKAAPSEWILEMDFEKKGDFLYSVVDCRFDSSARFDVRFIEHSNQVRSPRSRALPVPGSLYTKREIL